MFGDAAERMGVDLLLATDRCDVLDDPWHDGAIPVRFYDEAGSVASIVEASRRRPIDGIVAVGDRPTVVAAMARQALGLPGHSPAAAARAGNKRHARQRFKESGLLVPVFVERACSADMKGFADAVGFPAVLKPLSLSGSRGVMRVNDTRELATALARLRLLLSSADVRAERAEVHDLVLLESFVEGDEFALEGLMDHGTLHTLAIFDKPDPLDGPFFEETIYVTPSRATQAVQRSIVAAVTAAASALGLSHGPVHAECRVNEGGVFVLEVAARPIGGLCARALRFRETDSPDSGPDVAFEELLLRHALGESSVGWERESAASGVMMIPIPRRGIYRGVAGVDEARCVAGIDDIRITAKPDQLLVPLPEGASYLGFIFARAVDAADVDAALRQAHARLAFEIAGEVPMLESLHG